MEYGYEGLEGPPGLNGVYRIVNALDEDYGREYTGTVEIRPFGEVYNVTWTIDENVYAGVGIRQGNYLIAGWGIDVGVMHYVIKDNELQGTWAAMGANRRGVENLARLSPQRNGAVSSGKIENHVKPVGK